MVIRGVSVPFPHWSSVKCTLLMRASEIWWQGAASATKGHRACMLRLVPTLLSSFPVPPRLLLVPLTAKGWDITRGF